jgi:hypothetical protein
MRDPAKARKAAEELGAELARCGAKLLVYGGPFAEADVVRGFVAAGPPEDRSILMWYSQDHKPKPFPEEATHPKLFDRRVQTGTDWEVAFYRSLASATALVLVGGGNATLVAGQVAIGTRTPIIALEEFGGAAARVWESLSAGEDLPDRDDINLMARPWSAGSARACVASLLGQLERCRPTGSPKPALTVLAALLFLAAISMVPFVWGRNELVVWMLFIGPLLAGGSGAATRPIVDRLRGAMSPKLTVLATVVLGLMAGGIAGLLFVTAQLTADPSLASGANVAAYAQRSIPFAVGVGFIAGLTSDAVFGRLLGIEVARASALSGSPPRT